VFAFRDTWGFEWVMKVYFSSGCVKIRRSYQTSGFGISSWIAKERSRGGRRATRRLPNLGTKRLDHRTWKAGDLGNRKRAEERRCLVNVVNALHEVQITPSCMEDCQCSQGAV
jgi:hypothetical protein